MADSSGSERYVDRWEKTVVIRGQGEDHSNASRSVIVHRRGDRPAFLVQRIATEDRSDQRDSPTDSGTGAGNEQMWDSRCAGPEVGESDTDDAGGASEAVAVSHDLDDDGDDIQDSQVMWTSHWEGVDDLSRVSVQEEVGNLDTDLEHSVTLESDISLEAQRTLNEKWSHGGVDNRELGAENRPAIEPEEDGDDDDDDDKRCDEEVEQYSRGLGMPDTEAGNSCNHLWVEPESECHKQNLPCVDRWERTLPVDGHGGRDLRQERKTITVCRDKSAAQKSRTTGRVSSACSSAHPGHGITSGNSGYVVAGGSQTRGEDFRTGVGDGQRWRSDHDDETDDAQAQRDPRAVDDGGDENRRKHTASREQNRLSVGVAKEIDNEYDELKLHLDGDDEDDNAGGDDIAWSDYSRADSASGGHVTVVRRVERSLSIGEDGRRNQVTDRLIERRKTIEVDKEDLSGIEARHTSCLDIVVGGGKAEAGESVVSEISVIWGKTVETDMDPDGDTRRESADALVSPSTDSFIGSSLAGEYWKGDVSTDTARSSSSFDTYIDTGDSMFTSESNDSPRESDTDYLTTDDSACPPLFHSTPRRSHNVKRSEAFHCLWDPQQSPLQSKSFSLWEEGAGQVVTISSVPAPPGSEIDLSYGTSYTSGHENTVVSRLDVASGKTIDVEAQDFTDSAPSRGEGDVSGNRNRDNKSPKAAKGLFKVSEDISRLGAHHHDQQSIETRDPKSNLYPSNLGQSSPIATQYSTELSDRDSSSKSTRGETPAQSLLHSDTPCSGTDKDNYDEKEDEDEITSEPGQCLPPEEHVSVTGLGHDSEHPLSASFVERREEYFEPDRDVPQPVWRSRSVEQKYFLKPHAMRISQDAVLQGESSDLPSSPVYERPHPDSVDASKTFEDEEFVPLTSKKKKRLKKKKKKNKETKDPTHADGAGDAVCSVPDRGDDGGDGEDDVGLDKIDCEAVSEKREESLNQTDNSYDELSVGQRRQIQSVELVSPGHRAISEIEHGNVISQREDTGNADATCVEARIDEVTDSDSKDLVTSQDTYTDVSRGEEDRGDIHRPSRPPELKAKNDNKHQAVTGDGNDDGTKDVNTTAPPVGAEEYLTQILQDAEVDPQTMLLHSEGYDGDVLLNVSKGRRRILKPHRRFTKSPHETENNEAEETVDGSPAKVSHYSAPPSSESTADGFDAGSGLAELQTEAADSTTKTFIVDEGNVFCKNLDEEFDDKGEAKNRKRLAGGQMKLMEDQSLDILGGPETTAGAFDNEEEILEEEKVSQENDDICADNNKGPPEHKDTTHSDDLPAGWRQVVSDEDLSVCDRVTGDADFVTRGKNVGVHDDVVNAGDGDGAPTVDVDTKDGDHVTLDSEDVSWAVGDAADADDVVDEEYELHVSTNIEDTGADGEDKCLRASASVVDGTEDVKTKKPIQPQDPEDNPLLWPKKGKKKKKKKNKKDKQHPSGFKEVKDSGNVAHQTDLRLPGEEIEDDDVCGSTERTDRADVSENISPAPVYNDAELHVKHIGEECNVVNISQDPADQRVHDVFDKGGVIRLPLVTDRGERDDSVDSGADFRGDVAGAEGGYFSGDFSLSLGEHSVDRFESFADVTGWEKTSTIERSREGTSCRNHDDVMQLWSPEPLGRYYDYSVYPLSSNPDNTETKTDEDIFHGELDTKSGDYGMEEEDIDVDASGRKLDCILGDLVSNVDIHSVGDIKICIDEDLLGKRNERLLSQGDQIQNSEDVAKLDGTVEDEKRLYDRCDETVKIEEKHDVVKKFDDHENTDNAMFTGLNVVADNVDSACSKKAIDEENNNVAVNEHDKPPADEAEHDKPVTGTEALAAGGSDHPDSHKPGKKKKKKKQKLNAGADDVSGGPVARDRRNQRAGIEERTSDTADVAGERCGDIPAAVDVNTGGRSVSAAAAVVGAVSVNDSNTVESCDDMDSQTNPGDVGNDNPEVDQVDIMPPVKDWTSVENVVDRHEEYAPSPTPKVIHRRLLEDVVSNRARAQEVAARDPEITSTLGGTPLPATTLSPGGELSTPLTAGGHLLSEMGLLETAAREQAESLRLAVAQQAKYESQIEQLNSAISEAQGKLLASPVMATSVGALKQQMAEHNDLASQIKHFQSAVSEITEKNRELALDSAHLSPKLFRKHYLPESAYDDYFSAAQIHHRVGSPLPASSPLFYETLPTFELTSPRTYSGVPQTAGDKSVVELPESSAHRRKETSLPNAPSLSLDLPRKIPPPKKDTIPRPTWSDGTPNSGAPGIPAPTKSPGVSTDNGAFFRQSETFEAPGESLSTSGYATAPSSARSVGAGVAPTVNRSDVAYSSAAAKAQAGPELVYNSPRVSKEKPQTSVNDAVSVHRTINTGAGERTKLAPQRYSSTASAAPNSLASKPKTLTAEAGMKKSAGPRALSAEVGPQKSKRQDYTATMKTPSSSRDTASLDSGLDTGTNASLNLTSQRQLSPASSVGSVVERLAAAMAASPPTRAPPAGGRPTELLRMGSSTDTRISPRATSVPSSLSPRSGSVDSLVRQRAPLDTSLSTLRDTSTQDSFHSLLASPRVVPPAESVKHQQQLLSHTQTTLAARAPWKSVSESNLTASMKSPRFGDASATSTPRSALTQVITGTAVVKSPRMSHAPSAEAWASLHLDAESHVTLDLSQNSTNTDKAVEPTPNVRASDQVSSVLGTDTSRAFSDLALLSGSTYKIPKLNFPLSSPKLDFPKPVISVPSPSKTSLSLPVSGESPDSSSSPRKQICLSFPSTIRSKTSAPLYASKSVSLTTQTSLSEQPISKISKPSTKSTTQVLPSLAILQKQTHDESPTLFQPKVSRSKVFPAYSSSSPTTYSSSSSQRVTSLSVTEDRTISVSAFSPLSVPKFNSPSVLLTKSVVDQVASTKPARNGSLALQPAATKFSPSTTLTSVRLGGAVGSAFGADDDGKSALTPLRSRGTLKLAGADQTEVRERSSSFGANVQPLGRPLGVGQDTEVKDVSWNTLQEQAQSKERELQAALQRQARYQQSVQQLTAKMERSSVRLADNPASLAAPLDVQIREFKETLGEIEDIGAEIGQARERGEQLIDTPDSEGAKALQSTLTMLEDRFRNLQVLADDKGRQLQEAKTHKERHSIERAAYEKRVAELREWLEEAKVRHASLTLPSDDPARLQEQIDQSKDIQEEVNLRLRQVSDLALQCDGVCEQEPPTQAEKLRNQLAQLQKELGDLKMSTIEKQAQLRASIKDSEKRRREMEEVDSNVARLQKWMSDTKEMTKPPDAAATLLQSDIHKELATDIKQHRQLVRQISDRRLRAAAPPGLTAPSDREVRDSWQRLSRHLAQKKESLQAILSTSRPGELVKVSLHAPARQADSANQLSEVKSIMGEMGATWRELQTQLDEKNLSLDEALTFQQQYQSALQSVSSWLDLAQQQLFTVPSTTEEHIRHNENLQKQLKSLQTEVTEMSDQAEELLTSVDSSNRDLVEACVGSLEGRLQLLADSANSQADDLRGSERDWRRYQDEVKDLKSRLQDTQRLLLVHIPSGSSLDAMVENNQKIEALLKKCELQLSELKTKEANLTLAYPKGVFPSELAVLQSNYLELNRRAMEKKAILQQSTSVQDQYQKMLNDYSAFLNTAQDKLKTDAISARDLNHLQQQLAAHKDFFSDLEVHQAMLTALADQCDTETRTRLQSQHAPLMSLTHVLVDQASLHGQRLERLCRQWTELEEKHGRLTKVLTGLKSQVPRPIASGDSLTTIQDKLGKYKRLQTELADERASVFEVVDKGKQILHSVNCPFLEAAVTDLADTWVDLNTDLTHELKRTETLGDQLSIFEKEAAVLTSWLAAAKMKLASFKQLSTSDLSNIGAVRTKVEKLLEFQKEIENQAPLKDRVLKAGQKLLLNQNYDTRGLSERLDNYESEWRHLEEGAAKTGEFLHERQMELMPSRQAMTELTSWINQINKSLEEDARKRVKTVADIEVMVKKYKGYKVEVTSKQMTLDFVNQSVLAPQPEEEHVTHEKLEFAEKLGDVNKKWAKVIKAINDRLASLEGINSQWLEYEQALERLQAWFREQEDKVKRYKLIGHEVGVRQTLKDCKTLQQQLQAKQADVAAVTSLGQRLVELSRESPGCQQSVQESLDALQKTWSHLEEQTRQLENLLTDMLGQWARYHTDLASLNQMLTQIEYALSQYTLIGGDIHTLRTQVDKLKKLQAEQQASSPHLESFTNLSGQLRQVCEPPVQLDLHKTVSDVQTRWQHVAKDLSDRLTRFDQCLSLWQSYEDQYSHLLSWLDTRETLCSSLLAMRDDPSRQSEALTKGKNLQQELDSAQARLSELYRLSDQLTGTMDPSTIATLTARQSALEQRMMALRQVLQQHLAGLSEDLSMLGRFNQAFQVVEKFLTYAAQILTPEDPGKSDEELVLKSRLDQLRQLLLLFNTNYIKLDDVNDLGYRLALKDADAKRLLELNHRWQTLYEDANERSRMLQGHLLVQQDFTAKCEAWMTFLAHTESDLAREIKGNLRELQDQLRGCEQFESEMYSNQQILHAIISDGQKMMRAGEVEDVEEFQQKLQLLSEQWHSVTQRARQRRAIIEGLISKWQQFNASSRQLRVWLQDKEAAMAALEFDSDSLQVIRNLAEKVKMIQHEFQLQEATFRRIHDLGSTLQQHGDQAASREVKMTLEDLQQRWERVYTGLSDQLTKLDKVDRQWLDCEDDIKEILAWLQDIRHSLYADIPSTHEGIQEDLNKCRDIASMFASAEDKRQSLVSRERRLGRLVQTEDMNLLHQRMRLLNKQWVELRRQAALREQQLTEALFKWTNLGERIRSLMDWIEKMETKITSNRDLHVEDLLAKLENEYKVEMLEKEEEKKEVVTQGRKLMQVSSEIRASDIEQKILRLEDKWEHLVSVMDFRHRKLQETVLAVKQLDTSMKNLSRWLSQVESQLSGGLEFKDVGLREIQMKLQDTQELQEDIEQHSAGVSAVLNLCEVLLHDQDACPTQTEFLALQHAMKNLEKRWRNICNLSPRRRTRVEETWELWEKFRTDCQAFSDWLSQIEEEVRESEIEVRDVVLTKQEISKYESLQRNVHDHLGELENINRQYRQLAKDGRTDTDGQLRVTMTDLNNRWDAVQIKVTEIMKKLHHSATIRKDFEETRTSLVTWLTDVDTQLSDILHSTSLDLDTKVLEIRRIEDEVHTKRHRMDYLDQAGVYLMQKGDSQEALTVQAQLEDFRLFSSQVLERVVTTQLQVERLVVQQQVEDVKELEEEETARLYQQTSADRIRELRDTQTTVILERQTAELERYLEESPPESPPAPRRQNASPSRVSIPVSRYSHSPVRSPPQRSASPSPIRTTRPPVSSSTTRMQPEVSPVTKDLESDRRSRSRSPSKVVTPRLRTSESPLRRMSPSPSRKPPAVTQVGQDLTDSRASLRPDVGQLERSVKLEVLMEQLVESLDDCNLKLARLEQSMGSRSGLADLDQQLQLLVECEVAVDGVTRLHRLLKTESGVTSIASADAQVQLVLQRWELLQRRAMDRELRISQHRHDLTKLAADADAMLGWLDEAEALQASLRTLPEDIGQLDRVVRQYKDFLVQLESRKPTVLSINLLSRTHLGSRRPETKSLRVKVQEMNRRWELVLARAEEIQMDIQTSLLRCQEFHHTIEDYQVWLESLESRVRQLEPLNLNQEEAALWSKYTLLVDTHTELQRNQSKVLSTKETADQLLVSSDSPNMCAARDSIHSVHKRMRSLMHLTTAYISSLENKLNIRPSRGSASSSLDLSEGRSSGLGSSHASRSSTPLRPGTSTSAMRTRARSPFAVSRQLIAGIFGPLLRYGALPHPDNLSTDYESLRPGLASAVSTGRPSRLLRVIRTALPIQLLLLLLLLLACLVPVCEDEHSCLMSNNLRHSFSPMLRYTDGAPPT